MPKIPVDEAPAGPWLDAAVAQALGHLVAHQPDFGRWFIASDADALQEGLNHGEFWEDITDPVRVRYCSTMPKYSSRIEAAWELVEKLVPDFRCDLTSRYNHSPERNMVEWGASFVGEGGHFVGYAPDAPLAIARAYLKAKGMTEIETQEEALTLSP